MDDRLCLEVASGQPVGEGEEELSLSSPPTCIPLGLTTLGNCRKIWASLCLNWNALRGSQPQWLLWWWWAVGGSWWCSIWPVWLRSPMQAAWSQGCWCSLGNSFGIPEGHLLQCWNLQTGQPVCPAESFTVEYASHRPNFGRCSWDWELHSDLEGGRGYVEESSEQGRGWGS